MENAEGMKEICNFSDLFDFFVKNEKDELTPESLRETGALFGLELTEDDCEKMFMYPWDIKKSTMNGHEFSRIVSLTLCYF